MEAYTTANPFFWIITGVLALWLIPCLFWGNLMWWAWTRKVEDGPNDQLWIGWLEISKAIVFGRRLDAGKRKSMAPLLEAIEKLPKALKDNTHRVDGSN